MGVIRGELDGGLPILLLNGQVQFGGVGVVIAFKDGMMRGRRDGREASRLTSGFEAHGGRSHAAGGEAVVALFVAAAAGGHHHGVGAGSHLLEHLLLLTLQVLEVGELLFASGEHVIRGGQGGGEEVGAWV